MSATEQYNQHQDEIAALRTVLAGYVRDIEHAHARVEAYEMQIAHDEREREGLMEQVQELRNAWTASRHYKRLRNYSQRLSAALQRAETAESALSNIKAFTEDPYG